MYKNFIAITNKNYYKIDYLSQIEKIAGLKPRAIILREKDLTEAEYEALATKVFDITNKKNVPLYIHSYVDIAKKIGCKNIHIPIGYFEQLTSSDKTFASRFDNISVSCHSLDEAKKAEMLGASQIVLGTIFETTCKPGLVGAGLDFVKSVTKNVSTPVYAIGGITRDNITSVIQAGASGGCMMSGFA